MSKPMGPTAYEMLKYMRDSTGQQQDNEEDAIVAIVIPIDLFNKFEKALLTSVEFEPYYEDEEKQQKRIQFLKNILHIHNKAIFDSLNECLDHQRPFGIWGLPFPWKKHPYRYKPFEEEILAVRVVEFRISLRRAVRQYLNTVHMYVDC